MNITITAQPPTATELEALYRQARFPISLDGNKMSRALTANAEWFVARDTDNSVVGIGRLVTDGVRYGFVVDVIVEHSCQRQGIGTSIMEQIMFKCRALKLDSVHLWPSRGKVPFYQRFGFEPLSGERPHMECNLIDNN